MGDLGIHMQTNRPNEKINFKPLHEGVGFHPFSEGLPYAPQSKTESKSRATANSISPELKKDYSRGTGAMSAGSPSFAMPKTTRQIQQQSSQNHFQKPVVNTKTAPTTQSSSMVIPESMQSVLRKRFFAYLLDTVVHMGFWITVNLIAAFSFHFELDSELITSNWFGFSLFFAFSQWIFIAMQEMLFENSLGKSFFGLEFKRNRTSFFSSALLLRSIIFMMGLMTAGIGLLFLPQDKIAEIQLKRS